MPPSSRCVRLRSFAAASAIIATVTSVSAVQPRERATSGCTASTTGERKMLAACRVTPSVSPSASHRLLAGQTASKGASAPADRARAISAEPM